MPQASLYFPKRWSCQWGLGLVTGASTFGCNAHNRTDCDIVSWQAKRAVLLSYLREQCPSVWIPMLLVFQDRPSSSRFVERVWRCHSNKGGTFLSMAEGNIEMVFTRVVGFTAVTLRGPVTHATTVECPPEGEWLAIRFRLGTYFPRIASANLLDHQDLNLPILPNGRFWFSELSWEIPNFENAEDFVARLANTGVIARDSVIEDAVMGDVPRMSPRSVQRHVLRATGMTLSGVQQIERARHAAALLKQGCSILDVTHSAGYADQAHLTRSVKRLIGMTPARLLRDQPQLSFSFKT